MTMLPKNSDLILVVIMNNLRDFEIARVLGWYRIPLRSAPKIISVDYLAFYQTSVFGEEKWRIQYYAPVRGHELTTRAELIRDEPEHPHANQDYFKIQLGPIDRLPKPILAKKWRRITFFYTTGEHLRHASTVDDLLLASEERPIFWQALRERASQTQTYIPDEFSEKDLDSELLALLLGLQEMDKNS